MNKNLNHEINKDFEMKFDEKISIFIGAYGSGKSEVSVNFALFLANWLKNETDIVKMPIIDGQQNDIDQMPKIHRQPTDIAGNDKNHYNRVVLADLDIINPYYRSVDAKGVLEKNNIHTIFPQFANTNVEIPAVPGEIFSVFDQPSIRGVLDIGGEDLGARVVSNLKSRIISVSYKVYMVVNLNRPFTNTKDKIILMMRELEAASGVKISGLVNNTNLLSDTCDNDLTAANSVLVEVSRETGVPIAFASGMDDCYPKEWGNKTPDGIPFLRLSRTISYDEPFLYD